MATEIEKMCGWTIFGDEISPNIYKVNAIGPRGETIEVVCSELELDVTIEKIRNDIRKLANPGAPSAHGG